MDRPRNTWWCPCGEHGIEHCQPAAAQALVDHLTASGHSRGEYFYGCCAQRTAVRVEIDSSGRLWHRLLPPEPV